ncbi:hypothetical protein AAC387_Pa01g2499 [Persea americana]
MQLGFSQGVVGAPSSKVKRFGGDDDEPPEKRSRGEKIGSDEDDDLMMLEVSADEAVTNPIVASKEEPRDSELTCQKIPTTLSHPWMQLLMMLRMRSWRQKAFRQSLKKVVR